LRAAQGAFVLGIASGFRSASNRTVCALYGKLRPAQGICATFRGDCHRGTQHAHIVSASTQPSLPSVRDRYQSHYVLCAEETGHVLIRAIIHTKQNQAPALPVILAAPHRPTGTGVARGAHDPFYLPRKARPMRGARTPARGRLFLGQARAVFSAGSARGCARVPADAPRVDFLSGRRIAAAESTLDRQLRNVSLAPRGRARQSCRHAKNKTRV
jgi:hypothetical protein